MADTLREAIEALPRYAMAQYATDEPYPNEEGWIVDRVDVLEVIARFESPSPEGLDVERLVGALAAIDARIVAEHPEEAVVLASSETVKGRRDYARALATEYARLAEDADG